jgi:hypothetical protein
MSLSLASSFAKTASAIATGSACFLTAMTAGAVGSPEPEAHAKGVVGGALVLAELTLTIEAAVGVKPWWGYLLGGGLGAVGGAVGGYFIADAAGPEVPTAMLIGGLVLAVPSTIFVLSQTSYRPPESTTDDQGVALADPRIRMAMTPRMPSLLERNAQGRFGFGIPAVSLSLGAPTPGLEGAGTSFQIPVLDLQFR